MSSYRLHVDCFTTKLEDMPRKAKGDMRAVYDAILSQGGRFSTFDIDEALAPTITKLFADEYLKDDGKEGYPYSRCAPTEKGLAWRDGRMTDCTACSGQGHTTRMIGKRSAIADPCTICDRQGYLIRPPHSEPSGDA